MKSSTFKKLALVIVWRIAKRYGHTLIGEGDMDRITTRIDELEKMNDRLLAKSSVLLAQISKTEGRRR